MRTVLFVFLLCFCYAFSVKAQLNDTSANPRCGFGYVRHLHGYDTLNQDRQPSMNRSHEYVTGEVYTIPVVVHIIHEGGEENIGDSEVYSQLAVLNEDYGMVGPGTSVYDVGVDSRIRFCLATVDPDGKPTTGIERIYSPYTHVDMDNEMLTKNLSRWDQNRYLNIWVVKEIKSNNSGLTTEGYAYLPSDLAKSKDYQVDGLVIAYHFFGRYPPRIPASTRLYNGGRTATHEIGHYFDLLHIWGGDNAGQGGCDDDDGIDDTPDCDGVYYSTYQKLTHDCDKPVQCGYPRMIEDYMDYSEDRCMNTFTRGQAVKMRSAILKYRPGLVTYPNQVATGCKPAFLQNNPTTADNLEIHPNPFSNTLSLYPNFVSDETAEVYLFNIIGQPVAHFSLSGLHNDKTDITMPWLDAGIYEIVVQTSSRVYRQKMLNLEQH